MPFSIRQRLVYGIFIAMALILSVMGYAAYLVTDHESEEIFSARLATSARVLEALVARQLEKATITSPIIIALPDELEITDEHFSQKVGHSYESKIAFQVWHQDGVLLARSASAPNKALGPLQAGFQDHRLDDELWHVFALQSGQVWVLAAEKHDVRDEMSRDLGLSILTPLSIGALILLIVVNMIALINLKPISHLAESIAKRDPSSMKPLQLEALPDELKPVVDELNHLLVRVQDSVKQEKRFIDAAAHEIRTPIAALKIHVENAIHAQNDIDRQKSLAEALKGLRRTTRLAQQLLAFSRVSRGVELERKDLIDLESLLRNYLDTHQSVLQLNHRLQLKLEPDVLVMGDTDQLERLLQNLIDNAVVYGEKDSVIEVSLARVDEQYLELIVANDGPPIADSQKEKVFDPYYRVLGGGSSGSGLGLAIVKEIVLQHGGQIYIRDKSYQSGVQVIVRLPLAQA